MAGQIPRPIPKSEASVIDIFDYSRDDPFERVQMNAIDDMAELRDVLEKSQTPPSENKGSFFLYIWLQLINYCAKYIILINNV